MTVINVAPFKPYTLKAKLSWYNKNPVNIKIYNYILTQYTPSVFANIYLVVNESDFIDFKQIDLLAIEDRTLEIWFEPELYSNALKKSFNSGPFKYCVIQYTYSNLPPDFVDVSSPKNESARYIKLMCVDRAFYKMTLNQRSSSYGKSTTADVVSNIIQRYGAKAKKIVQSNYSFRWLQPQLTDYQMIRSILPYSQAVNNDLLYTFFMYNNEAYFSPISTGKINPIKIILDDDRTVTQYQTTDKKLLIEKYGDIDKMMVYDYGYNGFEMTKPMKMNTETYTNNMPSFKQHAGNATKYIQMAIDDKTLQKIYVSNLRHRIYTFSRIMSLSLLPIPDITPIDCIEVIKEFKGSVKDLDGIFYVLSVSYTYGMTNNSPIQPIMSLTLSSELDAKSMQAPEGKAV